MIDVAADYGAVPCSREDGAMLRTRAVAAVDESGVLVRVDWSGVAACTPSFADEFFGKMPKRARPWIKVENLSPPLESLARFCIAHRDEVA